MTEALMEDQVSRLQEKGIKAMRIPAKSSQDEIITLFDNLKFEDESFDFVFSYDSFEHFEILKRNARAIDDASGIEDGPENTTNGWMKGQ